MKVYQSYDPLSGREAPCEECGFESRCSRNSLECHENYGSLADWVIDSAIEEARLRRAEREGR